MKTVCVTCHPAIVVDGGQAGDPCPVCGFGLVRPRFAPAPAPAPEPEPETWGPHRMGWCDECGGGEDGARRVHAASCSFYRDPIADSSPGESTEWDPVDG